MPTFRKRLGRWRVEVVRAGVRESATFDSKREASEWATRREAELLDQRRKAVAGRWTLRDAFERYAREVSPSKRGARWERVRLAKLAKDPSIATRPLRALCGADVAAWRDRRLREVAPASVAREMNLVRSVLEIARKEWEWIKDNPMRDVARPARPPGRDRRITEDEATRICLALGWAGGEPQNASQRVAVMFRFAIETGMRAGEITGLTPARIHAAERYAQLAKSKNGEARKVPLSNEALRLLALLPPAANLFNVSPGLRDALFRKARDRAGVADLRFHDARHEAITRLARKLDLLDLARMVGHRDLRSLRTYYNATPAEIAGRLD